MKRQRAKCGRLIQSRRGAAMVFALVSLVAASSMIAIQLRTASISHRQLKRDELRVQATLLADAGVARAISKLRQQTDFAEETWTVPSEQLLPGKTAIVRLKIIQQSERRVVSVVAEFPAGRADAVKVTRHWNLPSNP